MVIVGSGFGETRIQGITPGRCLTGSTNFKIVDPSRKVPADGKVKIVSAITVFCELRAIVIKKPGVGIRCSCRLDGEGTRTGKFDFKDIDIATLLQDSSRCRSHGQRGS